MQRFLHKSRYGKPIYIITGLKIARGGAQARSGQAQRVGAGLGAEVDATVFSGVPITTGPEIRAARRSGKGASWEGGSDFVFAFRVRKVLVGRGDAVKKEGDYTKGAMLGYETSLGKVELELRVLSEEDGGVEDGFEAVELVDGEGVVVCAVPSHVEP